MKPTGATKEAAGHSPLPWSVVEYDFICSGESTVAELTYCPQPKDERRANVQLIVTAVNERERLREALRQVREACNHRSLEMIGQEIRS